MKAMEAKSPENRDELEARFQKILGRAPTKLEMDELIRDKEEMGLGYYDPLLIQLMSFKRERIELDKRLNGLTQVLHRHEQTMQKQLEEARDHVLKETDKALLGKMATVVSASSKALEDEKKRLEELHRKTLTTSVETSTKAAVKEKFDETWAAEWKKLQEDFKRDWKQQVDPKLADLKVELQHAEEKFALLWMGTLLLGLMMLGLLGWVWWERLQPSNPPESVVHENRQPVKPPQTPGSRK